MAELRKIVNCRIEDYRKSLNLTQEEFGNRLGKGRSTVNNWEQGVVQVKSDDLRLICSTFGVSSDYLLGLSETVSPEYDDFAKLSGLDNDTIYALIHYGGAGNPAADRERRSFAYLVCNKNFDIIINAIQAFLDTVSKAGDADLRDKIQLYVESDKMISEQSGGLLRVVSSHLLADTLKTKACSALAAAFDEIGNAFVDEWKTINNLTDEEKQLKMQAYYEWKEKYPLRQNKYWRKCYGKRS